jgi:serine/threonine protein kinase
MSAQKFGRYIIKTEIGRGGMATVFHAYDPRFERDVAIKVLPKEFLHDPQFRTRFEREAKTIALLEHPAIVPVYDFGEEEGQPYIVMRYMSGGSMSERIAQGAIPIEETVQLFNRLAPALDAAHAKGVIHRDLKPGNILYDQYGNAFLSDFGIARLAQASGATLTGGNILGTPAYMSPEQVQGDKEIDGRSDIYAMGVIMFQMLTGNAPYQATTPARVMMMHILEPVPSILEAKKDLPVAIQTVMVKAMAKDPDDRYASASEMAASLEGVLFSSTPPRGSATVVSASPIKIGAEKTRIQSRPSSTAIGLQKAVEPKKKSIPVAGLILMGVIVIGIIAIAVGGGIWLATNSKKPAATLTQVAEVVPATQTPTLPPPTDTPVPTPVPATDTPQPLPTEAATSEPTEVPTETAVPTQAILAVGGADQFAFLNTNEIWVANIDGSQPRQITSDGTEKTRLQWLPPDYTEIIFLTGKCVKMVNAETTKVELIACFENSAFLEDFKVSPDGKLAAISLDHEHLYIVPFNLETLRTVNNRRDLVPLGECKVFSPYVKVMPKTVMWSKDGKALAFVFQAPVGSRREDNIREISVADCVDPQIRIGVDFPAQFFTIKGYKDNPTIHNFGWDGEAIFSLNGIVRNGGYGDLYLWNNEANRPDLQINPIGSCCYRDSTYSPDGRYLMFAYQAIDAGNKIQLFYIPLGTIGTGVKYSPLPLPEEFFPNRTDSPQPVIRPSR